MLPLIDITIKDLQIGLNKIFGQN